MGVSYSHFILLGVDLPSSIGFKLIKFDIWTIVQVLDLYFSWDVVIANVFMTFWCKLNFFLTYISI